MPSAESTVMFREAAEAAEGPEATARFALQAGSAVADLTQRLEATPPPLVVTCARGSSDHAATYAKYLIETKLGLPSPRTRLLRHRCTTVPSRCRARCSWPSRSLEEART